MKVPVLPLLATAVALLLWGISSTGGGDTVPTTIQRRDASPRAGSSERLVQPTPRLVTPDRTADANPNTLVTPAPRSGEGALAVTLLAGDNQSPVANARLVVYDPSGSTGTEVTAGRWSQTTRANGQANFSLPPGRPLRLSVRGESVGMENSSVELPAFSAGEQRNLTVQLGHVQSGSWGGRLLDISDGAPVAGAEVRLFSRKGQHSMTRLLGRSGRPDARSDDEGRFVLEWSTDEASFAGVYALGYGPMFFEIDKRQDLSQTSAPIRLQRSAAFELKLIHASSSSDLRLTLATAEGQAGEPSPSPMLAGPLSWSATVNSEGVAQILGIPPHVALNVQVWKGETQVHESTSPITLAPSERRVLGLDTGSTTMLTGVVRDEAGKPVSHSEVWMVPAKHRAPGLLTAPGTQDDQPVRAVTDAGGRYEFHDPEPGDWWVGPAPGTTLAPESSLALPMARWVHLPKGLSRLDLNLTAQPGVYLQGTVQDATGAPISSAPFRFRGALDTAVGEQQTDEQGQFRAGPLMPGLYDVWIAPDEEHDYRGSLPRTVRAGSDPVHFTVYDGSWIVVRAVSPGEGRAPRITRGLLTKLDPSPSLSRDLKTSLLLAPKSDSTTSEETSMELRGNAMELHELPEGLYGAALYSADGRVAVMEQLDTEQSDGPAEAHAVLKPVGWLLLEHLGSAHGAYYQVLRGKVIVGSGSLGCGALAEIPVPPGELVVEWAIQGQSIQSKKVSSESHGRIRVHF